MAAILTAEDVVRRIAVECVYIDERGGVGTRLEPATPIVWRYGEQFRRASRCRRTRSAKSSPCSDRHSQFFMHTSLVTSKPLNGSAPAKQSKMVSSESPASGMRSAY